MNFLIEYIKQVRANLREVFFSFKMFDDWIRLMEKFIKELIQDLRKK